MLQQAGAEHGQIRLVLPEVILFNASGIAAPDFLLIVQQQLREVKSASVYAPCMMCAEKSMHLEQQSDRFHTQVLQSPSYVVAEWPIMEWLCIDVLHIQLAKACRAGHTRTLKVCLMSSLTRRSEIAIRNHYDIVVQLCSIPCMLYACMSNSQCHDPAPEVFA